MPELRRRLGSRKSWLVIAAVALAAAAIFDWARPAERQVSVRVYERVVIAPYRSVISPALSKVVQCRFRPTCSQYSVEAMRRHGFVKGLGLTLSRLFRCAPWTKPGTVDPVPGSQWQ